MIEVFEETLERWNVRMLIKGGRECQCEQMIGLIKH